MANIPVPPSGDDWDTSASSAGLRPDHADTSDDASLKELGRRLARLATPIAIGRMAVVGLVFSDTIMLARYGTEALGHSVLGTAVYDFFTHLLFGGLMGVATLAARAYGAGDWAQVARVRTVALWHGFIVGCLLGLCCFCAEPLLLLTGQTPELAQAGAEVTSVLAWGVPGLGLLFVCMMVLEGLQRPLLPMLAMFFANLVNVGLNYLLIFGVEGWWPPMGAVGAALSTVGVCWSGAVLLLAVLYLHPQMRALPKATIAITPVGPEMRRLGAPMAVSVGIEGSAFNWLTLMVGWLGIYALAAHTVLFQLLAVAFMFAFGLGSASQVMVGEAWGRQQPRTMARVAWTATVLGLVATGLTGVLFLMFDTAIVAVFTSDVALVATILPLMPWVAASLMTDGGQSIVNQSLRGRGETWMPTGIHLCSYYIVMVPLGYELAWEAGYGLAGVFMAVCGASLVSLLGLSARLAWVSYHRPLPPVLGRHPLPP